MPSAKWGVTGEPSAAVKRQATGCGVLPRPPQTPTGTFGQGGVLCTALSPFFSSGPCVLGPTPASLRGRNSFVRGELIWWSAAGRALGFGSVLLFRGVSCACTLRARSTSSPTHRLPRRAAEGLWLRVAAHIHTAAALEPAAGAPIEPAWVAQPLSSITLPLAALKGRSLTPPHRASVRALALELRRRAARRGRGTLRQPQPRAVAGGRAVQGRGWRPEPGRAGGRAVPPSAELAARGRSGAVGEERGVAEDGARG